MNPYRMFDALYGLEAVSRYEGKILGTLSPHLFAVGAAAYNRLVTKNGENQVILTCFITGTISTFSNILFGLMQ